MTDSNQDKLTLRDAIRTAAFIGTAAVVTGRVALAQDATTRPAGGVAGDAFNDKNNNSARDNRSDAQQSLPPGEPGRDYTPVVVPNGWVLPFKVVNGVKVLHMVAEEVDHEFAPGLRACVAWALTLSLCLARRGILK